VHDGSPLEFIAEYTCFGLLALLLAVVFMAAGNWGVVSFLVPLFLARQMFVRGRRVLTIRGIADAKARAFLEVSERIADERRDERLGIAADLHDEVLPPLYKVHLMGQVLRQDLAGGRLLALEDDLPELLAATDGASDALRLLIRDLRKSPLGTDGLAGTLRLLVRHLQTECNARLVAEIEDVAASPLVQLLAYQVAREALRNAIRHADANIISVRLTGDGPAIRIAIEDDGRGFIVSEVNESSHFGLQLMRERVELAGGVLTVDSRLGAGTRVAARLPAETARRSRGY
jgi:signal transduction histidine kinase